jgi:hypothetical protein
MSLRGLVWCGEGDLFSDPALILRKLYTSRRRRNTKSARNTRLSHTASHTTTPPTRNRPNRCTSSDTLVVGESVP